MSFVVDDSAPRVLSAAQKAVVPLTLMYKEGKWSPGSREDVLTRIVAASVRSPAFRGWDDLHWGGTLHNLHGFLGKAAPRIHRIQLLVKANRQTCLRGIRIPALVHRFYGVGLLP
jgi:hypothetical protein